jgi:hypothetical protein
MKIKYFAVLVLTGALFGLVYSIEKSARPVTERQPGAAATAATEAPVEPGMTPTPAVPGAAPAPAAQPGHEGHAHGPGDGHNH